MSEFLKRFLYKGRPLFSDEARELINYAESLERSFDAAVVAMNLSIENSGKFSSERPLKEWISNNARKD